MQAHLFIHELHSGLKNRMYEYLQKNRMYEYIHTAVHIAFLILQHITESPSKLADLMLFLMAIQ